MAGSSTIYCPTDVLKTFLKPKYASDTIFTFKVRNANLVIEACLQRDNEKVLQEAMTALRDIVLSDKAKALEFQAPPARWKSCGSLQSSWT